MAFMLFMVKKSVVVLRVLCVSVVKKPNPITP